MNNKILLTGLVLVSLTGTTFAAGINNTVNSTAAYYGAEAYGNSNKIEETGRSAFAVGYKNTVSANNALAYGVENKAEGINSLVGGEYSKATGRNSVAIGSSAQALQDNTFAIGSQARTSGENTVAIGNGAYANGVSSIVLGRTNTVNGDDTTVVGANNGTVEAHQSAVVGYNNKVVGADPEQLIFGSNSQTGKQGAIIVGTHGKAIAQDAIAFGNNTIADKSNSVAIGTNSVTDGAVGVDGITINGTRHVFAGKQPASVVSFGSRDRAGDGGVKHYNRQLQNVSAGRVEADSLDAINGSQLFAVVDEVETNATNIANNKTAIQKNATNIDKNAQAIAKNKENIKDITIGLNMLGDVVNDHEQAIANNTKNIAGNTIAINTLGQKVAANTADIRALEHTTLNHEGRITILENENKDIKDAISDNSKLIDKNIKNIAKNTSDINILDNKINDVGRNVLERANHYTDTQVNKGVAKASALAGLKFLDYNPKDKWSFAASVGHYRNANAVAVGAAYQPNENTMIHGGVTLDGKVAYNLGVSFKTGGQKQVTRHELEEQIRQLENNNIRMQEELNEIRAMLEKK